MSFEEKLIKSTIVEVDEESSENKDISRTEEPWSDSHERYFSELIDECNVESSKFTKMALRNRIYFKMISLPVVILPISISVLNKYFDESTEIIRMLLLLMSGTLSAISIFLNFGKKVQLYSEYAGKYKELGVVIKTQLIKKKRFRVECDVFSERVKMLYLELNKSAPL